MNSRLKWGAQYPRYTSALIIIFLSAIAVMQVIFWTEDNFCSISDCRNSFNWKLKNLLNKQIIVFYSPSNTLYSSEKSVQTKHFKHHIFICSLSTWLNLQMLISVNEDTASLKQIEQTYKCAWLYKPGLLTGYN